MPQSLDAGSTPVTLETLQDRLAALREARASNLRRVRYRNGEEERETEFKSDADLATAIRDLERQIASLTGARSGPRTIVFRNTGGW